MRAEARPAPARSSPECTRLEHSAFSRQNSYLVLAGLADGLVAVFSVVRGAPDDSCSYLCSHTANRSKFGIADDDVRQNPYPVKAMEVVNSGSEVWCSNGPGVLVVDCAALDIRRRLEPFCAPSLVTSIVCSSECRGEEVVWCLDDRANSLVMYHSATYQLCARYFCGDPNPLRDVFPVGPAGPEPLDGHVASPAGPGGDCIADVTIIYSEDLGTQILTHQDSVTDYCSLSSGASSPTRGAPLSPASSSSAPSSAHAEDPPRLREPELSPVDADAFSQHLQAVKVLAVKDVIWVPRWVWGWPPGGARPCACAPLGGAGKGSFLRRPVPPILGSRGVSLANLGRAALGPSAPRELGAPRGRWGQGSRWDGACRRPGVPSAPRGSPPPAGLLPAPCRPHPALPLRVRLRRRGGDVIVIGLEKDAGAQRGRVVAVLKARELTARG